MIRRLLHRCVIAVLILIGRPAATADAPGTSGTSGIQPLAAAVRAIEVVRDQDLFSKPFIVASVPGQDGVLVTFSVPISNVMVTAGRKATSNQFAILVQPTEFRVSAPTWRVVNSGKPGLEDSRKLAGAAARALERVYRNSPPGPVEAEVEVTADDTKQGGGFDVMVTRIPYAPGAHTLIELGRDLNVVQVIPGR